MYVRLCGDYTLICMTIHIKHAFFALYYRFDSIFNVQCFLIKYLLLHSFCVSQHVRAAFLLIFIVFFLFCLALFCVENLC